VRGADSNHRHRRFSCISDAAGGCGARKWILSLPQLAARLAGGFTTPLAKEHLDSAIQRALAEGGFVELEKVRNLPGVTRAVSRTLRKVWNADVDLRAMGTGGNVRLAWSPSGSDRWHVPVTKSMTA
jgi:hypothetical protein